MMTFIEVSGEKYEVVLDFDVLYCGWECDSAGWVVKTEKGLQLVHSNHGRKYFASKQEFIDQIEYYEDVIANTKKALELVGG